MTDKFNETGYLLDFLWRFGHFRNPDKLDAMNVKFEDLDTLTLDDKVVKDAVSSIQGFDANMENYAQLFHGRGAIADGDVGPATIALVTTPRCGCPDFGRTEEEAGSGSWPIPGCNPKREDVHSIRVGIDAANAPSKVKEYLAEALLLCRKAWAEIGLAVEYILSPFPQSGVEIRKRFERLNGSVIGWNEFPSAGTCRQTIDGRLDNNYAPGMLTWANLELHETGHGVRLEHTRGGIMNPSIITIDPMTWIGDPSERTVKRFFGGVAIPLDPDGGPGPTPPTSPVNGLLTIEGRIYQISGKLIL